MHTTVVIVQLKHIIISHPPTLSNSTTVNEKKKKFPFVLLLFHTDVTWRPYSTYWVDTNILESLCHADVIKACHVAHALERIATTPSAFLLAFCWAHSFCLILSLIPPNLLPLPGHSQQHRWPYRRIQNQSRARQSHTRPVQSYVAANKNFYYPADTIPVSVALSPGGGCCRLSKPKNLVDMMANFCRNQPPCRRRPPSLRGRAVHNIDDDQANKQLSVAHYFKQ
ncbi:hypothetical protein BC938DRAFT_471678 [Jimgerdemannia flammicorona]|uniref:Uncharacterized protein n=1 Tax=Jimgerdemannia flammicorona TaxID=994334 RepID=A0A433Q7M6_9FUNG|nr:hypothetical protein BC938DRAFT_471678 [Jimgerdemannia flammicorona]